MRMDLDYFIFPIDYFNRHNDWYTRLKYYENYCKSLTTNDLRFFTYTFLPRKSQKELVAKLHITATTLRKCDKFEIDPFSFQKVTNQYIMIPRRYCRAIISMIEKSASHTNAQIWAKSAIWIIAKIYEMGQLIGTEEYISKEIGIYKDTTAAVLHDLIDAKIIKRTKVGNSIQKTASVYIFS